MRNKKSHKHRFKDTGNPRYRLTKDEADLINSYRRAVEECENEGVNPEHLHSYWIKNKNASLYIKPQKEKDDLKKIINDFLKEAKQYSPKYPKIERHKLKDGHLLFVSPSDLHIGKLCRSFVSGEEYNNQVAVYRCLEGINSCLQKSSGFPVDQIILLFSGDLMHIDNFEGTTTKGTKQDYDGLLSDHFQIAKRLMVEIIEKLLTLSRVHIMYTPGNHDNLTGWLLAELLSVWFRHNKDVSFDISLQKRKYYKYHNSLIASTHGDKINYNQLPLVVADEAKDWGNTKYRYLFTQHIHHKQTKQVPGLHIESLMSPSECDNWHHSHGYQSSNNKAIEAYLFSKTNGMSCRFTHLF